MEGWGQTVDYIPLFTVIGAKSIAGRYLPGSLTNPAFENYNEPELIIVSDPWLEKQVIKDAIKANIPIIGLCDTNNSTENIDLFVPCNNKGNKSLSLIYHILAREYLRQKRIIQPTTELDIPLKDF